MNPPLLNLRVQRENFNLETEMACIQAKKGHIGAVVNFIGYCRDEGGTLDALEIEHYAHMAEIYIRTLGEKAVSRFKLDALTIVHRYGLIAVGEEIVLVISAAAHRSDAFDAASFVMDHLKTEAPFWKKPHRKDGQKAEWVQSCTHDEHKRQRW